jgi:hypothetical protein
MCNKRRNVGFVNNVRLWQQKKMLKERNTNYMAIGLSPRYSCSIRHVLIILTQIVEILILPQITKTLALFKDTNQHLQ